MRLLRGRLPSFLVAICIILVVWAIDGLDIDSCVGVGSGVEIDSGVEVDSGVEID